MDRHQIIAMLYELSEDYIAANCTNNSNDAAYNKGFKEGVEGFRRHMLYNLRHCYDKEKDE